jgi:DNA-binding transcriptional LysR family regulator
MMSIRLKTCRAGDGTLNRQIDFVCPAKGGTVVLACVQSRFRKVYPQRSGVDIRIYVGNRHSVIATLRDFEADIALMGRPPEDFSVTSKAIGPNPYYRHRSAGSSSGREIVNLQD